MALDSALYSSLLVPALVTFTLMFGFLASNPLTVRGSVESQDHTVSSIFLSEDPVLPLSPAEVEPQAATEESMATAPIRAIVFLPNFIVLSFLVMGNDGTWRFVPSIVSF